VHLEEGLALRVAELFVLDTVAVTDIDEAAAIQPHRG
jgi:hypothetical protein